MFETSIAGSLPKPAWLAETNKLWPQWRAEGDALLQAKADASQAGAIPWLLLSASSVGSTGRFTAVTAIQRVNTQGGVAPQGPCAAGQVEKVPYTADYLMLAS